MAITITDAQTIIAATQRLVEVRAALKRLEIFKPTGAHLTLKGYHSGPNGRHTDDWTIPFEGEAARGFFRKAFQLEIAKHERTLRGLGAEVPQ